MHLLRKQDFVGVWCNPQRSYHRCYQCLSIPPTTTYSASAAVPPGCGSAAYHSSSLKRAGEGGNTWFSWPGITSFQLVPELLLLRVHLSRHAHLAATLRLLLQTMLLCWTMLLHLFLSGTWNG
jgi:hypothetical protein